MLVGLSALSPEAVALLARASGQGSDEAALRAAYGDGRVRLLGWVERGAVVALVGYEPAETREAVTIRAVATNPCCERSGLGRRLLSAVQDETRARRLVAETDDDAVGFYAACGFSVTPLGEKYPGVRRYRVVREADAQVRGAGRHTGAGAGRGDPWRMRTWSPCSPI